MLEEGVTCFMITFKWSLQPLTLKCFDYTMFEVCLVCCLFPAGTTRCLWATILMLTASTTCPTCPTCPTRLQVREDTQELLQQDSPTQATPNNPLSNSPTTLSNNSPLHPRIPHMLTPNLKKTNIPSNNTSIPWAPPLVLHFFSSWQQLCEGGAAEKPLTLFCNSSFFLLSACFSGSWQHFSLKLFQLSSVH